MSGRNVRALKAKLREARARPRQLASLYERAEVVADGLQEQGFHTEAPYDFMWGPGRAVGMTVLRDAHKREWLFSLRFEDDGLIHVVYGSRSEAKEVFERVGLGEFVA
jgi:hypothetical protein